MSTTSDKTGSTISLATSTSSDTLSLPWIMERDHLESFPSSLSISIDTNVKPGQYVLQSLFAEFTIQAERKIEKVMGESLESPLAKSLQRREDPQFDQLLSSLSAVAEHCLPSLLKTLFEWYDLQNEDDSSSQRQKTKNQAKGEKDFLAERRDLAVDFLFCLVLIEVLKQLPVHPVPDEMVVHIETLAFKHFKHREVLQAGPNAENFHIIADLYAEVLGVVAQTRYMSVRKRFLSELKELRSEPQNVQTTQSIISLIMGMKFYRVKMMTMDDFEASCKLLHDCANYFVDLKDKDIKHALAGLLVEILIPVAACVKHEVNIPVLKSFVEKLYQTVLDPCSKKKHSLAYFPLVTCLLCVSQKQFFLSNWHYFLTICLSHLKHQKEAKMSRVALESLYRLLWVYMVRIKCESNNTTNIRLQSIVNSLFPRGSRNVVPRDTPLFIFVKIIQFISQEKLDFAVRDVIFDLVGVGSGGSAPKSRVLCPERMNIGLRAFLVIADSRQQKDGTPPMPATTSVMPSGNTLRVKKTFLSKQLTEEAAKSIGMITYYPVVCKALNGILQMLDREVGRPLLMTNVQCVNKESDDVMTGERKLKIELFRTCVAAIPRLIPEGLSRTALLELLSRLTVHRDEELRGLAFTALQNMMMDLVEWREEIMHYFVHFVLTEVHDTFPLILENSLKMLVQLLSQWRTSELGKEEKTLSRAPYERNPFANTLNMVEGFSLVFLCSCRPITRRLAVVLLKEVRMLFGILGYSRVDDDAVIDIIDRACATIVESFLNQLPPAERAAVIATPSIDLHWLVERSINTWSGSSYETTPNDSLNKALASYGMGGFNPWIMCLASFFASDFLPHFCPTAVYNAWPFVYHRLSQLYSNIDASAPSDSRISIRAKKTITMMDGNLALWRNYLVFACSCAPPSTGYQTPRRCLSPEPTGYSPPDNLAPADRQDLRMATMIGSNSASTLFNKYLVPLLRCENTDIREAVVTGLGWTNAYAFRDLMDELQPLIRDAIERKQENMRRRRRRDFLRVHLIRVLELLAEHGVFKESFVRGMNKDSQSLNSIFVEYIDGMRLFLESEGDKDSPTLQEIRLHFSGFIHKLIRSMPVENRANLLRKEAKYSIFFLCGSWCRKLGVTYGAVDRNPVYKDEQMSHLEMESLQAMSALLVCGEVFDQNALYQEGYLYSWLDNLLDCPDERVHQLGKETAILLLENNPKLSMLLTWTIDRCYTSHKQVADGCFQAMAAILNSRETYPCDLIPTLCVILLKAADACRTTRNTALNLMQVLHMRFFPDELLQATYGKSHILLSQELAKLHPELTLAIFSELTERFDSALLNIRQNILEVLLPWLYNIELVESSAAHGSSRNANKEEDADWDDENECPLKGNGWGSERATNIVLNNMFFITAEYGEEHTRELQQLWAGLCKCWPGNLCIILDYLFLLSGIATNPDLLPYVKMVLSFIAGAKSQSLVKELLRELLSWDPINTHVERITVPPYFRPFNSGKLCNADQEIGSMVSLMDKMDKDEDTSGEIGGMEKSLLEKNPDGVLFSGAFKTIPKVPSDPGTRERTDSFAKSDSTLRHSSCSSLGTLASGNSNQSSDSGDRNSKLVSRIVEEKEEEQSLLSIHNSTPKALFSQWRALYKSRDYAPLPLPTPDELHCAPLYEDIDDNEPPHSAVLHRCNLAVVLMADLVTERLDIDWAIHLPNILHVVFLGLDHSRPLVHEHSKRLLLNLLIVLSTHNDYVFIAQTLLSHDTMGEMSTLVEQMPQAKEYDFTGSVSPTSTHPAEAFMTDVVEGSMMGSTTTLGGQSTSSTGSSGTVIAASPLRTIHKNVDYLRGVDESAKALIEFLVTRKCRPMWCSEVITPRVVSIKSAEQIEVFLRHVVKIFKSSLKTTHLEQRWSQVALQLALVCPIRHYAGRSFQMVRALSPSLNARMMSDILRRLVDTVADQAEENQGYVTEILLTLEAMIEPLAYEIMLPDIRDRSKSGTVYSSRKSSDMRKSTGNLHGSGSGMYDSSKRHASNMAVKITENATQVTNGKTELRGYGEHRTRTSSTSEGSGRRLFTRSISTTSIKSMGEQGSIEEKLNLLIQLFWISVSLLESDYEYEFSLALKLIDKLLKHLPPDRPEVRSKMESVLSRLKWQNFPGLQSLLLKGFTSASTSEATLHLIAKLTVYCHLQVVDPTQAAGFPMNVIAVLPYLIQHFEQPDKFAMEIANNISRMCSERYTHMAPLSTVLTMYSEKTYNRDSKAWTGVVCKYVHNNYSQFSISMMTFLIEVLEKGPMSNQLAVLTIVYSLIHNVDLMSAPMQQVNDDLLRVIAKYVQGPHWKESLNILKLAVSRSSSLVKPSTAQDESRRRSRANTDGGGSRKDLPGRTMEFTFDLSKMVEREDKSTPVIRRKFTSMMTVMTTHSDESAASTLSSDDSSLSTEPTEVSQLSSIGGSSGTATTSASANQSMVMSAWRKPQHSQRRTRDRLVKVLQALGQNVGVSRSPSVIFSSTSDIALERQPSTCSSETTSLADNINNDNKLNESDETFVFKDFDFLDVELEGNDEKAFNWCVSRQSLESLDTIEPSAPPNLDAVIDGEMKDSSDDDETNSNSGVEDNTNETLVASIYDPASTHGHLSPAQSYSSIASELEGLDSNSANFSSTHSTFIYIPVDEVEEVWRSHVQAILNDTSGKVAVNTFHTFMQLFKVMCQRFCNLTREVCNYLGDKLRDVATQFLSTLELLRSRDDCPYVYVDTETMLSANLLERHKYCVLELQEHYNTYVDKRDLTVQNLDAVKTSLKIQTMSLQGPDGRSPKNQQLFLNLQVNLCRKLYRLHFQLLMLYDSYCKLVTRTSSAKNIAKITDCSSEVNSMRIELIQAISDVENSPDVPHPNIDTSQMTPEVAVAKLENCLATKQFKLAILQLHNFRSMWSSNVFGSSEEDDLDVLIALCCKQCSKQKTGVLVITSSNNSLADSRNRLTDANMQLRSALTLAETLETKDTDDAMEPPIIVEEASSDVVITPKAVTSPRQERLTPIKEILATEGEKRFEEKEVDTSKESFEQSTESEVEEVDITLEDTSPLQKEVKPDNNDADVMEETPTDAQEIIKEAIVMQLNGGDEDGVDEKDKQSQAKYSEIEQDIVEDNSKAPTEDGANTPSYQDNIKRIEVFTSPERIISKSEKESDVKPHSSPDMSENTPLDSLMARLESSLVESKVDPDTDEDNGDEEANDNIANIEKTIGKDEEEEGDAAGGTSDDVAELASTKTKSEDEKLDRIGVFDREIDSEPSSPTVHSTDL
ncbi:protein furry homolog [Anneissia japonica]|uniref:protein furry homolog n=1 Tax=Anneissia japonica TaxID=1529436 RepID=UPI001425AB1C|nr:protein furry homolog [Anneissia japonica]